MTWLDRLLLPRGEPWRRPPEIVPDPTHRRWAWLVGLATLVALAAFVHGHATEARLLTPEYTRSILTQVGFSSVAQATAGQIRGENPLGVEVEFATQAYAVYALYLATFLFDNPGSVPSVLLLKILVAVLNLMGAPLLFAGARRAGLRARPAAFVALAYLLSPLMTWKISWDIIGFSGSMLAAAYLAFQARRTGLAVLALFVAAGSHPFALWAVTWWTLVEWRSSAPEGRARRILRVAFAGFALQSAWAVFVLFVAPHLWSGSLAGYMEGHVAEGRFFASRFPLHLALVAGLLVSFLGLPLVRARWLWLVAADGLYYLGTGTNHGLVPSTTGLLAIASIEALRSVQVGAVPASLRRMLAPRRVTVAAGLTCLAGLAAVDVFGSQEHQYRHGLFPPDWDGAWIADAEGLAARVPAGVDLCLVQPVVFPVFDERCPRVLPWTWPESGARVEPDAGAYAVVVHGGLYDVARYPRRILPQEADEAVRDELCAHLAAGSWHVGQVVGSACLLRPGARSGGEALDCPGLCAGLPDAQRDERR